MSLLGFLKMERWGPLLKNGSYESLDNNMGQTLDNLKDKSTCETCKYFVNLSIQEKKKKHKNKRPNHIIYIYFNIKLLLSSLLPVNLWHIFKLYFKCYVCSRGKKKVSEWEEWFDMLNQVWRSRYVLLFQVIFIFN